jgi:hypothetical protein
MLPNAVSHFSLITAAFVPIVISGCGGRSSSDRGIDQSAEMKSYVAELERFKRDSVVIDSLSRLVDTDSLEKLTAAALSANDERPYRQEITCEYLRQSWRHGSLPAQAARARLRTSMSEADRRRLDRISGTGSGVYELSERACGPLGPRAPSEVGGST